MFTFFHTVIFFFFLASFYLSPWRSGTAATGTTFQATSTVFFFCFKLKMPVLFVEENIFSAADNRDSDHVGMNGKKTAVG